MKNSQIPRKWKSINLDTSNAEIIEANKIYMATLSDHYKIYDFAQIVNLSDSDATLILNHSQKQPLPRGNNIIISRKFNSIAIENIGTTNILINQIKINYGYTSTKEDFILKSFLLGRLIN